MQRARNLFGQNKIAIIWDFDKTLIPYDMQRPLFEHYGVDEETFWRECNALPEYYSARGYELVSRDQMYLLHILSYVKAGRFKGLTNRLLRQLGGRLTFYDGLPDLFQALKDHIAAGAAELRAHEIGIEHYVVSSGLRQMILGSAVAPYLDGVWACEYLEDAPGPGYLEPGYQDDPIGSGEIAQIIYAVDNTTKTRAIFEINKGTNLHPEIDVNAAVPHDDRRVPFENMIYVADGPSDVPVFSVVNQHGGKTLGVYTPGSPTAFRRAYDLQRQDRVQAVSPADYTPGSQTYLWLQTAIDDIAQRIVETRRTIFGQRVGRPPSYRPSARPPRVAPSLPLPLGEPAPLREAAPLGDATPFAGAAPIAPKPQDRPDPTDTLTNGHENGPLSVEAASDPVS